MLFFFNGTATAEIYTYCHTLSLHDALPIFMKAQIDHLPLEFGGKRPTQGRTLAVMQVSGGSQSFNEVNTLRLLGRWMRMITIPNQRSEEHTSELQSLMRISYAVFCLKKQNKSIKATTT